MFAFPIFRRQNDRSTSRRTQPRRRPLVEALEGRQLLSSFAGTGVNPDVNSVGRKHVVAIVIQVQGNHMGTNVAAIVGDHIGTSVAAVVGNHIGTSLAAVVGSHLGTNVA